MKPSEIVRLDDLRGAVPRATFLKLLLEQEQNRRHGVLSDAPDIPDPIPPAVPVFGVICAGDGLEVEEMIPGAELRLPSGLIVPEGAYGLMVRGDSMTDPSNPLRSIPDGSVAIFWPSPVPMPGSLVHVEWQDASGRSYATLKRLTERSGGGWELTPLNAKHATLKPKDDSYTIRGCYITRIEREKK